MIKIVLFDAIDTLFQAYPDKTGMYQRVIYQITGNDFDRSRIKTAWNEIVTEAEEESYRNIKNSKSARMAWDGFNRKMLQKLDVKEDLEKYSAELLFQAWSEPKNYRLYNDVKETLILLKKQGIQAACLSNENEKLTNFFVHFGIDQFFKFIITSGEIGYEKPHPKIFEIAISKTGYKNEEVLFVGDSYISDYLGAKNAGIKVYLLDRRNEYSHKTVPKIYRLTDIVKKIKEENDR